MNEIKTSAPITADDQTINVKGMIMRYLSLWKWFVASVVLFMGLGAWYLMRTTPLYESKASILIKDSKQMGAGASMLEELDMFSSTKVIENEMEVLRSYTLIEQVLRDLNLRVVYSRKSGLRMAELYGKLPFELRVLDQTPAIYDEPTVLEFPAEGGISLNGVAYPAGEPFDCPLGRLMVTLDDSLMARWDRSHPVLVTVFDEQAATNALRASIDVKASGKGTSVLVLSTLSSVPAKGERILDHLIEVYDQASIADKNNMARITLGFIDERLELLAADLKGEEQRIEQYKSSQGITDISSEAQIFLSQMQGNDAQLSQADIQLAILEGIKSYVTRPGNDAGTAPAMLGISDPTLMSLVAGLTAAENERAAALRTVKPANPIILALDDQIAGYKARIMVNLESLRSGLQATRSKLQAENRRFEKMIQSMPRKERELMDITRQQEIKNQQYVYLLSKREETAISYAATVSDSRLIDRAHTSSIPVKPVKRNILIIFLLLGLVTPVIGIFIRDLFDNKVNSKDEIEKRLGVPVVGEVAHMTQVAKIILASGRQSRDAEQIRTLRTNVSFMLKGAGPHVILITSSISGEGKSLITANMGAAYAAMGKRAVVLGFDLRKPGLHRIFGLNNDRGLSNYLTGQATLEQIIQHVPEVPGLDIITCGHLAPNPQELMQGQVMETLFEALRGRYDYIVVDTAPVGLVGDAKIIDRFADVSLFVIRQGFTPKDRLRLVGELAATGQLVNMGIVVNDIALDRWYGYNSSYGLDKYYGKYYMQDEESGSKK